MKYYIWVLGCQMNKSDSERIAGLLAKSGWEECLKEEEADLIVAVACSVRQSAINRLYGCAIKYQKLRNKNKNLKIILTGCVLENDKKKLEKIFDSIIGIKNIAENLLPAHFSSAKKNLSIPISQNYSANCGEKDRITYFKITPKYSSPFQAYVPIMTGCNNFCAYCVVPYTRGREWSRPAEDILYEIKCLVKTGCKEITLIGQNVNSYLSSSASAERGDINFPELLRLIDSISGDFWIRFATSHPKDISAELIDTVAALEKICPYIHLPIQAGSDKILEKMNRRYTRAHYLELIKKIKAKIPDVMLSTDIIVGFPGETKKDFMRTVDIFKKVKYTMAYIARYSPRAGTAAFMLNDDISKEEKDEREKILNEILKKTALENNKKFIGRKVKVLIEKEIFNTSANDLSKPEKNYLGKTKQFTNVKFQSKNNLVGQFAMVKIIASDCWGMEGKEIGS